VPRVAGGTGGRPPSLGDERPPRTEAAHQPRYGHERHARARWPTRRVRPPASTVYTVGTRPGPQCQPAVAAYDAQQRIFRQLAKRQRGRRRPMAPLGGRGSAGASRRSRVACGAVRYYMIGRCWRGWGPYPPLPALGLSAEPTSSRVAGVARLLPLPRWWAAARPRLGRLLRLERRIASPLSPLPALSPPGISDVPDTSIAASRKVGPYRQTPMTRAAALLRSGVPAVLWARGEQVLIAPCARGTREVPAAGWRHREGCTLPVARGRLPTQGAPRAWRRPSGEAPPGR